MLNIYSCYIVTPSVGCAYFICLNSVSGCRQFWTFVPYTVAVHLSGLRPQPQKCFSQSCLKGKDFAWYNDEEINIYSLHNLRQTTV